MSEERSVISIGGGRRLEIAEGGDREGIPVIVHNGTPAGVGFLPAHLRDATSRGIRLITYARPGYGGSTRLPGRDVAQAAHDVRALADVLGLDRFLTWGISGGGPHALALAALLPERVVAAACLSGPAPHDAPGIDWMAGMGEGNVVEFGSALRGESILRPMILEAAKGLARGGPANVVHEMASILPPQDTRLITEDQDFAEALVQMAQDAAEDRTSWSPSLTAGGSLITFPGWMPVSRMTTATSPSGTDGRPRPTIGFSSGGMIEPGGIVVRRLGPDDAEAWLRLRLEALRESPDAFVTTYDEMAEQKDPMGEARRRLGQITFGAWSKSMLVGHVSLIREERAKRSHIGHVASMYVAGGYRGAGIGQRLLTAALDEARKTPGLLQVSLEVVTTERGARAFYRRLGFKSCGIERRALHLDGRDWDMERMVLRLDGTSALASAEVEGSMDP